MNRIEDNASTHTFGPTIIAPKPQRERSVSRREVQMQADTLQVDRPTLIRSQTPVPTGEEQKTIARMFSENMFSDPPAQKTFGKFGSKLFTDGHQRLIFMLREECGRLFSFNKSLKDKLSTAERQVRQQADIISSLRVSNNASGARITELQTELRESQDALQEMDNMLTSTQNKRRNRLSARLDATNLELGEYAS